MYTFHHGFWLYFFSRNHPRMWQFVVGSMLPDYVYFVLLGILVLTRTISVTELASLSPTSFMAYLPRFPWAVRLDLAGHSVIVWGLAFGLTLLPAFNKAQAFVVGWGTHLLIDGLTHAAHTNFFLYPLSMLTVHSPVSYWEAEYMAEEFQMVNKVLMFIAVLYLFCHWCKTRRKEEE